MSQARQLLIVDDDTDLRQALVEQLALHPEFQVQAVETAGAALEVVATTTPDLIIMDVGLPDLDGREAVKRMRRDGYRRPVIMQTAHDSDADAVSGLPAPATRSGRPMVPSPTACFRFASNAGGRPPREPKSHPRTSQIPES